jgi:choline dehydrogenase-like flavoprotein
MAAHTLVRNGIPVTLLESGVGFQGGLLVRMMGHNLYRRVPPMEHGTRHVSTADPQTDWYFNLAPGGLSNQWTGAVPRFAAEDFTEGARLDERYRWPVTYEALVPYYQRAERLLDITADSRDVPSLPAGYAAFRQRLPADWQRVANVAAAHGQGLTVTPLADGPPWLITRQGTAFNSFTRIVRPLLRSPHFQLLVGAHALRLEWSGAKQAVESVLYHSRIDGGLHRLAARAVVVACGPLHSTKLLFDSACADFPQGLGNTEGILGSYLHDHPREWWGFDVETPISLVAPSGYLTRVPYATSPPLLATSWTLGVATTRDKILSRFGRKGRAVGVQVFGTMIPSERHYARPAGSRKDEFGLPLLDLCIRYDDDVLANIVQARERLLCLMEEAGYRVTRRPVVPQLFPGTSVHYGGTVRMHSTRRYGVLDGWNRLYDVLNVVVCDASCFTTGVEKNPTLTAMAIAARAADRLADDLRTR